MCGLLSCAYFLVNVIGRLISIDIFNIPLASALVEITVWSCVIWTVHIWSIKPLYLLIPMLSLENRNLQTDYSSYLCLFYACWQIYTIIVNEISIKMSIGISIHTPRLHGSKCMYFWINFSYSWLYYLRKAWLYHTCHWLTFKPFKKFAFWTRPTWYYIHNTQPARTPVCSKRYILNSYSTECTIKNYYVCQQ